MPDRNSINVKLVTTNGEPPLVTAVARYLSAIVTALNATEKSMSKKRSVRSRWYITGVDLEADGITFRIQGWDKAATIEVCAIDQNAPHLTASLEAGHV